MPFKGPERRISERRQIQRRKGTEKTFGTMGGKMFEGNFRAGVTPPLIFKDSQGSSHALYFDLRHSERRATKPDRRKKE